jgi:hypothetical protein
MINQYILIVLRHMLLLIIICLKSRYNYGMQVGKNQSIKCHDELIEKLIEC